MGVHSWFRTQVKKTSAQISRARWESSFLQDLSGRHSSAFAVTEPQSKSGRIQQGGAVAPIRPDCKGSDSKEAVKDRRIEDGSDWGVRKLRLAFIPAPHQPGDILRDFSAVISIHSLLRKKTRGITGIFKKF
jgi:hypothetical protein